MKKGRLVLSAGIKATPWNPSQAIGRPFNVAIFTSPKQDKAEACNRQTTQFRIFGSIHTDLSGLIRV